MNENVVGFGKVGNSQPILTDEEQARVDAVRLELQEHIFDNYEAEEVKHHNPARGKLLSPMAHMYSMLLSDAAILEAINGDSLEEEGITTDLEKVGLAQLVMIEKAIDITNKIFGSNFQDVMGDEYFDDLRRGGLDVSPTEAEFRQQTMDTSGLTEEQLSEIEALGYTLDGAYRAVKNYTEQFIMAPNFEATKEALAIHKETGEYPDADWYQSKYDDNFHSEKMKAIYEDPKYRLSEGPKEVDPDGH